VNPLLPPTWLADLVDRGAKGNVPVPVFSGASDDYPAWKRSFEDYALSAGVLPLITSDARMAAECSNWTMERHVKASRTLYSSLMHALDSSTREAVHIRLDAADNRYDGVAAWATVREVMEGAESDLKVEQLRAKLNGVRLAPRESADNYFARVLNLVTRLNFLDRNSKVSPQHHARCIANGLPRHQRDILKLKLQKFDANPDTQQQPAILAKFLAAARTLIAEAAADVADVESTKGVEMMSAEAPSMQPTVPARPFPRRQVPGGGGRWGSRGPLRGGHPRPFGRLGHAQAGGGPQAGGARPGATRLCYNCERPGHMMRDCRAPPSRRLVRLAQHRPRPQHQHAQANLALQQPARLQILGAPHQQNASAREFEQWIGSINMLEVVSTTHYVVHAVAANASTTTPLWVLDSGSTHHIVTSAAHFSDIQPSPHRIRVADGSVKAADGQGSASVRVHSGFVLHLDGALHLRSAPHNLVSVAQLAAQRYSVLFDVDCATVSTPQGQSFRAVRKGNLYVLATTSDDDSLNLAATTLPDSACIWHERLGHCSKEMAQAATQSTDGMPKQLLVGAGGACAVCTTANISRTPFTPRTRQTTRVLQLVHSDIAGPLREPAYRDGFRYVIVFLDDFSAYAVVYVLRSKDQAAAALELYSREISTEADAIIGTVRTDNGGEFIGKAFQDVLRRIGAKHERTIPGTPQQNGAAERYWRTLFETTRSIMAARGVRRSLWAYAVKTACYIRNRVPKKKLGGITPYQVLHRRRPSVAHLRVFGCKAVVRYDSGDKLEPRGVEAEFIGYPQSQKGYFFWIPSLKQVVISRDAVFYEDEVLSTDREDALSRAQEDIRQLQAQLQVEVQRRQQHGASRKRKAVDSTPVVEDPSADTDIVSSEPAQGLLGCHIPADDEEVPEALCYSHLALIGTEPRSYREAMDGPDRTAWLQAMEKEMQNHHRNGTWELVPWPADRKVVSSKWHFRWKVDGDGNVKEAKARCVARGFSQRQGEDYLETFAPVTRMESLRVFIAVNTARRRRIFHTDVTAAYLYGEIDFDIYMSQPEGFEKFGDDGRPLACHLRKSIYGLKQAGRIWAKTFAAAIEEQGLQRSAVEPCLFTRGSRDTGDWMGVLIYVDDAFVAAQREEDVFKWHQEISTKFKISSPERMAWALGIRVEYNQAGDSFLHQRIYAENILRRFRMDQVKPLNVPSFKEVEPHTEEKAERGKIRFGPPLSSEAAARYRSAVGALMYLANGTRPDILHAVNVAAKKMAAPRSCDEARLAHIFRYLRGTTGKGIVYRADSEVALKMWSDASYADDIDTRRSTSGSVCELAGGVVSYSSRQQGLTATSTTEAEYVAVSTATSQVVYLRSLLVDLDERQLTPTFVGCDNRAAIILAKDAASRGRTKHFDVKLHHIREKVGKEINLTFVSTTENRADVLTKAVGPQVLHRHIGFIVQDLGTL